MVANVSGFLVEEADDVANIKIIEQVTRTGRVCIYAADDQRICLRTTGIQDVGLDHELLVPPDVGV